VGEDKGALIFELYKSSEGTFRRLGRSLYQRLRAAASDGQGAFLAAALCFGVAAFLFHSSLHPQRISQHYLEGAIVAEQEPLRGDRHPVLAGLLLPQHAQEPAKEFLHSLDASCEEFTAAYFAAPQVPAGHRVFELTRQTETDGVGYAWTDSAAHSTLIVPSIVAAAAKTARVPDTCDDGTTGPACKLQTLYGDPIARSLAIEKLAARSAAGPEDYGVTLWYFISVEGIERSSPVWTTPQLMAADRLYSGTSYFYAALATTPAGRAGPSQCNGAALVKTLPYFDLGGGGVVQTVCYPVSKPSASPAWTAGVLCADLSLPRQLIMAQLEKASAAVDLSLVRVARGKSSVCSQWDRPCAESLSGIPASDAQHFAERVVADNQKPNSVLGAEGVHIFDGYFGITVFSDSEGDVVAVGTIRRSRDRDVVSLLGSSIFLIVGLCVLMISYRRKMRRREVVLARGLPLGVLRLDHKKRILGANDRAEEIFDRDLPGLGIDAIPDNDPQAVWIENLFRHEDCVLISSSETEAEFASDPDKLDPDGFLAQGTCADVLERIGHGYAQSFYARTASRWVRIGASPIVMPDLTTGMVVTVSTQLGAGHIGYLNTVEARPAAGAVT
jgi:hypothetical protein